MYSKIEWKCETNILKIVKITGVTARFDNELINTVLEERLAFKMSSVLQAAKQFNARIFNEMPDIPLKPNTIVVCASVIFSSFEDLESFKVICEKILRQG